MGCHLLYRWKRPPAGPAEGSQEAQLVLGPWVGKFSQGSLFRSSPHPNGARPSSTGDPQALKGGLRSGRCMEQGQPLSARESRPLAPDRSFRYRA